MVALQSTFVCGDVYALMASEAVRSACENLLKVGRLNSVFLAQAYTINIAFPTIWPSDKFSPYHFAHAHSFLLTLPVPSLGMLIVLRRRLWIVFGIGRHVIPVPISTIALLNSCLIRRNLTAITLLISVDGG